MNGFLILLRLEWTCDIDVAILFFMLASEITTVVLESIRVFLKISSSLQR